MIITCTIHKIVTMPINIKRVLPCPAFSCCSHLDQSTISYQMYSSHPTQKQHSNGDASFKEINWTGAVDCGYIGHRFLFLFVCMVTDFSAEDKASGVKFCTAVHRRPGQKISHYCEFCSPRIPKSDKSLVSWSLTSPMASA